MVITKYSEKKVHWGHVHAIFQQLQLKNYYNIVYYFWITSLKTLLDINITWKSLKKKQKLEFSNSILCNIIFIKILFLIDYSNTQ